MYRVVLDTNVFISGGTISTGVPAQIMNRWRSQEFTLVVSPQLLSEYEEVLNRDNVMRFTGLTVQENSQYIQEIRDRAYIASGTLTLNVLTNDPDDNMVLACAQEGMATHLVTKNVKHFPPQEYQGTKIVIPKEFLDQLNQ